MLYILQRMIYWNRNGLQLNYRLCLKYVLDNHVLYHQAADPTASTMHCVSVAIWMLLICTPSCVVASKPSVLFLFWRMTCAACNSPSSLVIFSTADLLGYMFQKSQSTNKLGKDIMYIFAGNLIHDAIINKLTCFRRKCFPILDIYYLIIFKFYNFIILSCTFVFQNSISFIWFL